MFKKTTILCPALEIHKSRKFLIKAFVAVEVKTKFSRPKDEKYKNSYMKIAPLNARVDMFVVVIIL